MKIVVAPQAYKGSLSADSVAEAICRGILQAKPNANLIKCPIADGGDGTLSTLVHELGGMLRTSVVCNAQNKPAEVQWGIINNGRTALIETAQIVGLSMLDRNFLDPSTATSRGIGQLILECLDLGLRDFIMAVGGSATNDGGMGMLKELGFRFTRSDGSDLPEGGINLITLDKIDESAKDRRLKHANFTTLCDGSPPLLGKRGASLLYSPQKGADLNLSMELEKAMTQFSEVVNRTYGIKLHDMPMAGCAGGISAGIHVSLEGDLRMGIDAVLDILNFKKLIRGADLIITGEGCVDEQTIYEKSPVGVSKIAASENIKCVLVSAIRSHGWELLFSYGVNAILVISEFLAHERNSSLVTEKDITQAFKEIFTNSLLINGPKNTSQVQNGLIFKP